MPRLLHPPTKALATVGRNWQEATAFVRRLLRRQDTVEDSRRQG
jgi:hypothetical protein